MTFRRRLFFFKITPHRDQWPPKWSKMAEIAGNFRLTKEILCSASRDPDLQCLQCRSFFLFGFESNNFSLGSEKSASSVGGSSVSLLYITEFINFIERIKIGKDTILVPMDVSNLYTNIPQEEGIKTVCKAYETFHNNDPPIPTHYLREMLGLILTENSFEFNKKNYLQTHGVAMGTKTAVSFANIFMAEIETNLILQNNTKPRVWKRYIDDVFSLWDCNRNEVERFIEEANTFHPTIKFTAEISENEITFLDTVVFKGERFIKESILDIKTHYKPTETFQYTHFTSCHLPGVKRDFIKGEAMRLLGPNSSKTTFKECLANFKLRLEARRYPKKCIESFLSEVTFDSRQSALKPQKHKTAERILSFVTTYHPAVRNLNKS